MNFVKYSNRKLYLKSEGRYSTLKEFIKVVRKGNEVTVIDFNTKLDITDQVLATALSSLRPNKQALINLIKESA